MSKEITYQLSYFRPGEPSSIDVVLATAGEKIHGFQVVLVVTGTPPLEFLDQSSQREGIQASIVNSTELNFLTNSITPHEDGYQIALAAITKNPQQSFSNSEGEVVAKLIFSQSVGGSIQIEQDSELTKISTATQQSESQGAGEIGGGLPSLSPELSSSVLPPVQPKVIATTDTGVALEKLGGEVFVPPPEPLSGSELGLVAGTLAKILPTPVVFSKSLSTGLDIFAGIFGLVVIVLIGIKVKSIFKSRSEGSAPIGVQTQTPSVQGFAQTQPQPLVQTVTSPQPQTQSLQPDPQVSQGGTQQPVSAPVPPGSGSPAPSPATPPTTVPFSQWEAPPKT